MKEIILIKNGEIALKGLNRGGFEDALMKNIKIKLKSKGIRNFKVYKAQSTIYVDPVDDNADIGEFEYHIKKVFGIAALARAAVLPKDFDVIKEKAPVYMEKVLKSAKTFKVEAKRSDKTFHLNSPQICAELGNVILSKFDCLSVDVHNPEVTVSVEIRDYGAYIHAGNIRGAGGMPTGTSGNGMLLLSGGIDSPAAGYMMAKRGLNIYAVHFYSPPYTSGRAKQKVENLCEKMTEYCGTITLHMINFTAIQEAIRDNCPEPYFTVIMRRYMMRIAQMVMDLYSRGEFGKPVPIGALITGESVGQVASQTLSAIACTDEVCGVPVFRPLIGMDKYEIVEIAKKIDTYDISALPYEDCCTVFTPKHPRTNPNREDVRTAEENLNNITGALMEEALTNMEIIRKY